MSAHSEADFLAAARAYRGRNWWVIPIQGKDPAWLGKGWHNLRLDPETQSEMFNGQSTGIGLLLGASGVVDLEADCAAAEYVLEQLAPRTACRWEHGGRQHRLYRAEAKHCEWTRPKWASPPHGEEAKGALVEVRAGNHQSVLPPSIHEDRKPYRWVEEGEPAEVSAEELYRVGKLAATAGAVATVWGRGARQRSALALGGFLRRCGIQQREAQAVLEAICSVAGDEEVEKRLGAVRDTYGRSDATPTTGLPTLAQTLGQAPTDWLAGLFRGMREPERAETSGEGTARTLPVESPQASWPEPLAPEAFHGLAGKVVATLEPHTEADPAALLFQFLTAFGSVIGRRAYFVAEADRHHLNLFMALVGLSAKGRKGSSWGYIRRLFELVDETWSRTRVTSGLSSGEGLIWMVRDPIEKQEPVKQNGRVVEYQQVITDPGVEDKRLLVQEGEFASTLKVLGREGNTLSAVVRNAWDTGSLNTITKNNAARATGAHISIVGHITRDELLRYLSGTEAGNGFGNRFLWICVQRSKALPEGGALDDGVLMELSERIQPAARFAWAAGQLRRDDAAREIWYEVYPTLSEGKPGLLGAMIARAEAQVMRLAGIYALLDESTLIRTPHMLAALATWDYAEASARFIFGDALGDEVADELLQTLRRTPEGMTRTEIHQHFGRNLSAGRIGRALEVLSRSHLAERSQEESGGRPAERWRASRASIGR